MLTVDLPQRGSGAGDFLRISGLGSSERGSAAGTKRRSRAKLVRSFEADGESDDA